MSPPRDQLELELTNEQYPDSSLEELPTLRSLIQVAGQSERSEDSEELSVASDCSQDTPATATHPNFEGTRIPRLSIKAPTDYSIVALCRPVDKKSKEVDSYALRRNNFRKRKSLSLMEIQRNRKTPRPVKPHPHQNENPGVHSLALAPSSRGDVCCYDRTSLKMRNDFYCFVDQNVVNSEVDSKLAGMRVFASIMLNAWRRRRDEVRRLTDEMGRIKKASIKTKNQIHVISSLFKVEQKTNDDLSCRLRRTLEDQQKIQDMYNDLNKAFMNLQIKYQSTESELVQKLKEIEDLNFLLGEAKSSLFKAMSRERELETNLSREQRKHLDLENEKNDLLNKIIELEQISASKVELEGVLSEKNREISQLKSQLEVLDKKLLDLKDKEQLVKEYEKSDLNQRQLIQELNDRIQHLENEINDTIMARTMTILRFAGSTTLEYGHLFLHGLLPMTPPPTKIQLNTQQVLEKALNFRWK